MHHRIIQLIFSLTFLINSTSLLSRVEKENYYEALSAEQLEEILDTFAEACKQDSDSCEQLCQFIQRTTHPHYRKKIFLISIINILLEQGEIAIYNLFSSPSIKSFILYNQKSLIDSLKNLPPYEEYTLLDYGISNRFSDETLKILFFAQPSSPELRESREWLKINSISLSTNND